MNPRRTSIMVGAGAAVLLVLGLLATRRSGLWGRVPQSTPAREGPSSIAATPVQAPVALKDLPERDRTVVTTLQSLYTAPISVHGVVHDETGAPIPNASVQYTLNDKYFKEGTTRETNTDASGRFMIKGKGMTVYIHVQKAGYYKMPERSNGTIRATQVTSASAPAVFVLKKAGEPQKLLHNTVDRGRLAVTGIPVEINLSEREPVPVGNGHLRVEVWVDGPPVGHRYNNFPWHCRVSVPGGGMCERKDRLSFEAPEIGYEASFDMTVRSADFSAGGRWTDEVDREVYLKLPNQTFARGRLHIGVSEDHALVSFESYWNPSGSRNLEAGSNWFGGAK